MNIVSRDLILQDESCVTCDHLLLGKFVFSWMENNIPLFVFVVAFFFFFRFSAGGLAQVDLHRSFWGRRKMERENALPVSTPLHLVITCLFEVVCEWLL